MDTTSTKRKQKKVVRYGNAISDELSDFDDNGPLSDDSFTDKNYLPEKNQDEKKNNSMSSSEDLNDSIKMIDFEDEFKKIDCVISHQSNEMDKRDSQPVKIVEQLQPNAHLNASGSSKSQTSFESKVLSQLQSLTDITKIMFARYAVIEESLLKNGMLASVAVKSMTNHHDEFHSFIKSKKMPFKTIEAFKAFEDSLDGESIENAVSHSKFSIFQILAVNIFFINNRFSFYR